MNKSTTTKTLFQAVFAATLVAALSIGARAADVAQVHVKYADLDISSPAGAAVLYQRIRFAATQVCGVADQRELARLANAKACADKAIADAVATVDNDTLTDVYQANTRNVAFVKFASN